jgi:hypothetical protein
MKVTEFKRMLPSILKTENLASVLAEVQRFFPPRQVVSPLIAALYHADDLIKWHAVSALGAVAGALAGLRQQHLLRATGLGMVNNEYSGHMIVFVFVTVLALLCRFTHPFTSCRKSSPNSSGAKITIWGIQDLRMFSIASYRPIWKDILA